MKNIQDRIVDAKDKMPDVTPIPAGMKAQSSAHDLKSRLEWGEPGLTILDVRPRPAFNAGHIMGAMAMPIETLPDRARDTIDRVRDLYVYGETDDETAQAVAKLREAGFVNVSELRGGLAAWKAIAGPTEGSVEGRAVPGSEGYNVVSQLANHKQTQESTR